MLLSKIKFSEDGEPPIWNAYTVCRPNGSSALANDIAALLADDNLRKQMVSLLATLETTLIHPRGPQLFLGNPKLCHEAVAGTGIYELIKKPLRLYWFYGEGNRVIIVSAVHHKKTQKTPPLVEKHLKTILKDYRYACANKTLQFVKNDSSKS